MTPDRNESTARNPFPRGVEFTRVPSPLLAGLLEEIDDLAELKVTLRAVWMLSRKRGPLAHLTAAELCADRTVAAMLDATGAELEDAVTHALGLAVERGTLLKVAGEDQGHARYLLNIEPVRRSLERSGVTRLQPVRASKPETRQAPDHPEYNHGAYRAYEENIGPLTPLVIESVKDALNEHPESDVIDAIRAAAEANARSWRYVSAVLRRWSAQGRDRTGPNGKPERHSEETRNDEFIQRYLERQRSRGRQ